MKHHLFYLGEEFYNRSRTMIGVLYSDNTKERWDWGFVSVALRNGDEVSIRPANQQELEWANAELKEHEEWRKTRGW